MFKDFSEKYIVQIERNIEEYYKSKKDNKREWLDRIYDDIIQYCLRPGKRIRPLLLIAGYESSGKTADSEIIKISAVLEIMHSFLLIHDDIIDKAEIRRGDEALHLKYRNQYKDSTRIKTVGEDVGMIVGDMMAFNCIEIISCSNIDVKLKNEFFKIFAETYEYTAWGQLLDIINSMPYEIIEDENIPLEISLYKTSYYTIANPLIMGAMLSGVTDNNQLAKIREFALPLGLAFQIRDDILGVFANDSDIGKSAQSDILEEKNTLLIQKTLQNLNPQEKEIFEELFLLENKTADDVEKIKSFIGKSGSEQYCRNKVNELNQEAMEKLENLKFNDNIKLVLQDLIKKLGEIK